MFERYTDRARRTVVLAQEEARLLNHNYIGTEHMLLGLIHEGEGIAAKALTNLGMTLENTRVAVELIVNKGQTSPSGHIPFTPRCKKSLELGLRESLKSGANYIGPEHLLLGMLRDPEGVAVQVMTKLGLEIETLRTTVEELIKATPAPIESRVYSATLVKEDPELKAMRLIIEALAPLDRSARGRVIEWAGDRHGSENYQPGQ